MYNSENCLASAWNKGLKQLFKKYNKVLVIGTDQEVLKEDIENLLEYSNKYPDAGLWSAKPIETRPKTHNKVEHGDGSFSYFIISKEAYEDTGEFDENFKPAYFEDNDYLERLWLRGYIPVQTQHIKFLHLTQGSVKYSQEDAKAYPKYMQDNLNYFKAKWNKVPDHLPEDIKFYED
jgi:GT2 family glycosyltransferase